MTVPIRWLDRRAPHLAIGAAAAGLALADGGETIAFACGVAMVVAAARGVAARTALLAAVAITAGVLIGEARLATIDAAGERLEVGTSVTGIAHLTEAPRPGPFGASVEAAMTSGDASGARLLVRLPRWLSVPAGLGAGTAVRLAGAFRRPEPGSSRFDFAAHLRRQGVAGELDVESFQVVGRRGGVQGAIDGVRGRSDAAIAAGLDPTSAALARGMVLGADEELPAGVRDDFRDAGLSHVLAVSGQNVVLLCALAIPLLMAVGLPYGARIPVLLGLIALYVPLTGAGPSIQRAGVMGAATLGAVALARPGSRVYALGLAACVTLVLNPRAYGDPGWQLSFAAVAGILLLASGIARSFDALPRVLAEGIGLTVAATVATVPLVAHHFGTGSLAGLPANVVALALIAPIMWLGMLQAMVGQLMPVPGPLGDLAAHANTLLGELLAPPLAALERLAAAFADMPGGQVSLPLDGAVEVVAAYGAIAVGVIAARSMARRFDTRASTAVAYVRRLPPSRRLALALAVAAFASLCVARGLAPAGPPANLTVSFLDVGQGDATLIQHPDGSAVLFDGGPPEGGVARLLRRAGVRRLSALVMTHASRDHHGGLAEVVERIPVDTLLDGGDGTGDPTFRAVVDSAATHGAQVVRATASTELDAGSLHVEILSPAARPPGPPPEDPNPRAVVAVVSCDGFALLLSGDAESETLLPLPLPDVDAMKIAHHGSADPGLSDVLEEARPEIASIPVGPNTYGHPAPSTLAALQEAEVPTWRNDRNGTVRIVVADGEVRVEAERGGPVPAAP